MAFTRHEEIALKFSLASLDKEIVHYKWLLAVLKKDGKDFSAHMVTNRLNYYQTNYNELKEVLERGYFREEHQ